jgi:DnaJ-class molecular chaperone
MPRQAHRGIVCSYPESNCPCLTLLREHVPQQLDTCGMCEGSGVETFNIVVYEPGCYFPHDSTDGRPCPECNGAGVIVSEVA